MPKEDDENDDDDAATGFAPVPAAVPAVAPNSAGAFLLMGGNAPELAAGAAATDAAGAPNTAGARPLMGGYPPELAGFAAATAAAAGFAAAVNTDGALLLIGG